MVTAKELWDAYKNAVNGRSYDGRELPEFEDAAQSAKVGWVAIAEFINSKKECNCESKEFS